MASLPPSLSVPSDCPVCLQPLLQPVRLPCAHVFCYLCVKGASMRNRSCPMCRAAVPSNYMDQPELVDLNKELLTSLDWREEARTEGDEGDDEMRRVVTGGQEQLEVTEEDKDEEEEYRWYYEGRNGWWQYDDRTQPELERAHREGETSVIMLIAGFNYQIDFSAMLQYRVNDPNRKRAIKREKVNAPLQVKGVAGIRTDTIAGTTSSRVPTQPPTLPAPAAMRGMMIPPQQVAAVPQIPPLLPQSQPLPQTSQPVYQAQQQQQPQSQPPQPRSRNMAARGLNAIRQLLSTVSIDNDESSSSSEDDDDAVVSGSRNPVPASSSIPSSNSSQVVNHRRGPPPQALMRGRDGLDRRRPQASASREEDSGEEEEV